MTELDDLEARMDAGAKDRARAQGVTFEKAMLSFLESTEGRQLYKAHVHASSKAEVVAAKMRPQLTQVRKIDSAVANAEAEIAKFADSIKRDGESEASAWSRALDARPQLYTAYLKAAANQ